MTKKFAIHGTKMVVSKQNIKDAYYRVELTDANGFQTVVYEKKFNKTSIGRRPKTSSMNKNKRRSFKKYRGQGK